MVPTLSTRLAGLLLGCLTLHALAVAAVACVGDCDTDGRVTVDEVLTGVNIALDIVTLDHCPTFDANRSESVTIDEILSAAGAALTGCVADCGDGIAEGREECDDGNQIDGDGCSAGCRLEPGGDLCAGIPARSAQRLDATPVASGLSAPVYVTAPPRDVTRIFIVEQTGRIRIVKWSELLPEPFLDVSARISCCGERGLLSIAFHPDYAANGQFFIDYTDRDGNSVVSRWLVSNDADIADPDSEVVVLRQTQPFPNHNGGLVVFGPDGYLYIGFGDGGFAGDPFNNAQNRLTSLGKLLRIDVNGATPYTVPSDNPFVGTSGAFDEIWALGLRNPWRFSFDRMTGDLYIADVGQNLFEEIDIQPPATGGLNYGWPLMEGLHCFKPPNDCPTNGLTAPVLEYDHNAGCSITGGLVYRGCAMPDLRGSYFYGDYCSGFVRSFVYATGIISDARDWTDDLAAFGEHTAGRVSSFGEDARGEMYLCDLRGTVNKIVPRR